MAKTITALRENNPRQTNADRVNTELDAIMNRVIDGTLNQKEAARLIAALTA